MVASSDQQPRPTLPSLSTHTHPHTHTTHDLSPPMGDIAVSLDSGPVISGEGASVLAENLSCPLIVYIFTEHIRHTCWLCPSAEWLVLQFPRHPFSPLTPACPPRDLHGLRLTSLWGVVTGPLPGARQGAVLYRGYDHHQVGSLRRTDPQDPVCLSWGCPRCSVPACSGLVPSGAVCRHLPPLPVHQPQGQKEKGMRRQGSWGSCFFSPGLGALSRWEEERHSHSLGVARSEADAALTCCLEGVGRWRTRD